MKYRYLLPILMSLSLNSYSCENYTIGSLFLLPSASALASGLITTMAFENMEEHFKEINQPPANADCQELIAKHHAHLKQCQHIAYRLSQLGCVGLGITLVEMLLCSYLL